MWAPHLDSSEALRVEGEHFVDSIENSKKPLTNGYFGLRVVKLIEAATRSMNEHGRSVEVNGKYMFQGRRVA